MIRKLRLHARHQSLAFGTLIAAAFLTACQPPANTAADTPAEGRAVLHTCSPDEGPSDAKCTAVEVFENRSAAAGRKINLHIVVLPAFSRTPAADPLFILAGGPGQAATELVTGIKALFRKVQAERDIVLVDQRGTGKSNPLDCSLGEYGLEALSRVEFPTAELRECLEKLDADPRLYTTPIAMDDLDDVRAALGYAQINVWGGSYGTRAALVYLRQHRGHVRSVVLDGAAPVNMALPLHVPEDGQRALDLLLADCEADQHCGQTFPNLREDFQALLARLDARPERVRIEHPRTGELHNLELRRDVVASILFGALYSPLTSSLVPLMIDRANHGDFQPLVTLAAARESIADSMSYGMFLSVICAEDIAQSQSASPPGGSYFLGDAMR
jgi:pimeloyl-ACP methyl ester carboxylesterase